MTPPQTVAARVAAGLALGLGLGFLYDLLRPLRPRRTALADGLFLLAVFYSWLELSFRICQADIRLGYSAALAAGWALWQAVPGRWVRPRIFRFWGLCSQIMEVIFHPVKKTFKKPVFSQKSSLHSH